MTCVGKLICDNNYKPFSLAYPAATFPSNKTEEQDEGFGVSFSAGVVSLSDKLPSAVENHLPARNLQLKLSFRDGSENKYSRATVEANFDWAKTFHPQTDDTSLLNLKAEGMLEIKTCPYLNLFTGMGLRNGSQSYRSPTYFYPKSGELEPWGKGGIQVNIPQSKTSLAALFEYRQIWGNYIFPLEIDPDFKFMGAVENRGTLGIKLAQKFNNRFAPDITGYLEYSIFGEKHIYEVLIVREKTEVNSKRPMGTKTISGGLVLDWKNLSVAGKYQYRDTEFFPPEHIASFNAEYRNKKYGDYGLGWKGLFGIEPMSPVTTHDIEVMARAPFLNRSFGVNISFFPKDPYHATFMFAWDAMRFYRHFANNGARSKAQAPAAVPEQAPPQTPPSTSSIIEYDSTNPNLYRLLKCGDTEAVKKGKGDAVDCASKCSSKKDQSGIDVCVTTWNQSKL